MRLPGHDLIKATLWRADLDGSHLQARAIFDAIQPSLVGGWEGLGGPRLDRVARAGYVSADDRIYRFDLDDATSAPEAIVPALPAALYPEGGPFVLNGAAHALQLDPVAGKIYWRQVFQHNETPPYPARNYRANLDGSNVEVLSWPSDGEGYLKVVVPMALDPYSSRVYGSDSVVPWDMSRWEIDGGEDLGLILTVNTDDLGTMLGHIALLPAVSGGTAEETWATLGLTGEGVAPGLSAAPDPLDFGAVPVGDASDPASVTLTSTGGVPVEVTGIAAPGAPFTRDGGDCPALPFVLAPESSCTLDYRFAPTTLGEFEQTITIDSTAGLVTFTLIGEGVPVPPRIDVDPENLSSTLESGGSDTQSLTLANSGDETLEWEVHAGDALAGKVVTPAASGRGSSAADGVVAATRSVAAIDLASEFGGALPSVPVLTSRGGVVDCANDPNLIVHDDGTIESAFGANTDVVTEVRWVDRFTPGSYPAAIEAVCVAYLALAGSPTALDFDVVVYDDDGAGGGPGTELGSMTVSAEDIPVVSPPLPAGFEPTWFSFDISALGITVAEGSVYIGVRFDPPGDGAATVYIAVDQSIGNPPGFAGGYWWNDHDGIWAPIHLTSGFENYRSLMVRAVRDEPIDCTLPAWISVDPTAGSVPAGGNQTVNVTFDAAGLAPGDYAGNLCFASNDPDRPVLPVPLALTVTPAPPVVLAFDPTSVDFGDVDVDSTSAPTPVALHNAGTAGATGLSFDLPDAAFAVDAGDCGTTLAAGATCTLEVTFSPSTQGAVTATLTVSADAGNPAALALAGNGVESPDADLGVAIETTQDYLRPGQIADYLVTLDNAGPATANGASITSQLSPALDLDFASWLCIGPASSGCTPEGEGDLADANLEVPAGGSITWLLSAPVRWDAQGPVETSVAATYPDDPNAGNNSATATHPIVVYRNGFEQYGMGSATLMLLDERLTPSVVLTLGWYGQGNGTVETVFAASPQPGEGVGTAFRIERFGAGPLSWARLVALDDRGAEIAGRWLPVMPGTYLTLALADTQGADGDGGIDGGVDGGEADGGETDGSEAQLLRTVFLMAPGGDLQIPLATTPDAYRIWSAIPVTITPLGN